MRVEEAKQHALGYAAGREDASGVKTVPAADRPVLPGFLTFADAFAQGWDDFNNERRFSMTNAQAAYEAWQASEGRTIFKDELKPCVRDDPFRCLNCGRSYPDQEAMDAHINLDHPEGYGEDVEFCDCTNEELEACRTCGQPQCPNKRGGK